MVFRSSNYVAIMTEKTLMLNELLNGKGWDGAQVHFPRYNQQNGCVQLKFATLLNRVYPMLKHGKFSAFLRNGLWVEANNIATLLENDLITPNGDLSPFQQFFGREREASCLLFKLPHVRMIPTLI